MKQNNRIVVTGGAGFLGSHLVEKLLKKGENVLVIDNLSSGKLENLNKALNNPNLSFYKIDLKKCKNLAEILENCNIIFHLAANPEVRVGEVYPNVHFEENLLATFNLLETWRKANSTYSKIFVFFSTSTVYGEASQIPTPENFGPLLPISTYGASKLGCEALVTSYAHTFNFRALILRLANIVGPRSTHGIVPDFVRKIENDNTKLEILGDGTQNKSYMYIDDAIDAILHTTDIFRKSEKRLDVYNISSNDQTTVFEIAKVVAQEMKAPDIQLKFSEEVDGGRGWKGDVKNMWLSIDKLLRIHWTPKCSSLEAIRLTASFLANERGQYKQSLKNNKSE